VSLSGGSNEGLDGALMHDTGEDGALVSAGDRPSLTAGQNFVQNSQIYAFGQWVSTYTPAVSLSGDGNVVRNNLIHDAPTQAILYGGSQHTIALNDIHDVAGYCSDCGAIYGGRDWGARGIVIRNNFIHDIATANTFGLTVEGSHAVYLDDCLSGVTVQGNLLVDISGFGILHGGGRDTVMTNNVIVGTAIGLSADARCETWVPIPVTNVPGDSWNLLQKLEAVSYQQPPWSSTYPACAAIPDSYATIVPDDAGSHWLLPEGSEFSVNIGYENGTFSSNPDGHAFPAYAQMANDIANEDPMFVDAGAGDYDLQPGSPAFTLPGFQAIPFDQIGVQP
jgi:hypothetical protein